MPLPHEILGVSKYATPEDIECAFRKLAKDYHPDRPGSDPKKFENILNAKDQMLNLPALRVSKLLDQFNFGSGIKEFIISTISAAAIDSDVIETQLNGFELIRNSVSNSSENLDLDKNEWINIWKNLTKLIENDRLPDDDLNILLSGEHQSLFLDFIRDARVVESFIKEKKSRGVTVKKCMEDFELIRNSIRHGPENLDLDKEEWINIWKNFKKLIENDMLPGGDLNILLSGEYHSLFLDFIRDARVVERFIKANKSREVTVKRCMKGYVSVQDKGVVQYKKEEGNALCQHWGLSLFELFAAQTNSSLFHYSEKENSLLKNLSFSEGEKNCNLYDLKEQFIRELLAEFRDKKSAWWTTQRQGESEIWLGFFEQLRFVDNLFRYNSAPKFIVHDLMQPLVNLKSKCAANYKANETDEISKIRARQLDICLSEIKKTLYQSIQWAVESNKVKLFYHRHQQVNAEGEKNLYGDDYNKRCKQDPGLQQKETKPDPYFPDSYCREKIYRDVGTKVVELINSDKLGGWRNQIGHLVKFAVGTLVGILGLTIPFHIRKFRKYCFWTDTASKADDDLQAFQTTAKYRC